MNVPPDSLVPVPPHGETLAAGQTFSFSFDRSRLFPGTVREITVYVPAQYRAESPACVYISFDGLKFDAPRALDELITRGEVPVLIGIGISAGVVPAAGLGNPRHNRSFEFDSPSERLAQCVLEEILPEVERRLTPNGRPIRLSRQPEDRCVAGASSGAIAAFTCAWQRPDAFRRVFSAIGTYVGMRGGDRYPVLVRKTEPKPIRVFLQDGSADQWGGGPELGDWWMSNQALERALTFAGYEVRSAWGTGGHDDAHATAVFTEAMRWLWRDWPAPITAGRSRNRYLEDLLHEGEPWQQIAGPVTGIRGFLARRDGTVLTLTDEGSTRAIAPDGTSHSAPTTAGEELTPVQRLRGVAARDGSIYALHANQLILVNSAGERQVLDESLNNPTTLALSPDGAWLALADQGGRVGHQYRIEADGSVGQKQPFYTWHSAEEGRGGSVQAWCFDREGRLYAATDLGVQVFDYNGRVRVILPLPGTGPLTDLTFGGSDLQWLYCLRGDTVFRRRLQVPGDAAWLPPASLPAWGPG